ncbi:class I SAM-dependent methyltransferase [Prosthecobacter sp.]|uniref:class I SAM-dependent methyltransferase n=1 Tax=Prosthecobacter sp. TaxID=1965333 RepID=UPI0037831911
MSQSPTRQNISLGRLFLPASLRQRFELERYHVCEFVRREAIPALHSGMQVLDAGSGRLKEQVMREELLASGATLHTLDFCAGPGVDFVGDVSDLPFKEGSYDAVICTQVLEHVKSPPKTVSELVRVLKPGGMLYLTAPQSAPLHNLPWHFFNPTKLGIQMLLEDLGMEVVKIKPQGCHFSQLATVLHFTVPVLQQSSLPKIVKFPAELAARFLFGFVAKLVLIPLDKFDTQCKNAGGWCFAARKPQSSPSTPSS